MSKLLTAIGLLLLVAIGRARGAAEVLPSENAVANSKLEIQTVMADWQSQRPEWKSGEFVWRLTSQIRASGRGNSTTADPDADEKQQEVLVRFNSQGLKLEGNSELSIRFGGASQSVGYWKSNREFSENLISGISGRETRRSLSVPYTVLVDRARESHIWGRGKTPSSFVVTFPVSTAGPMLKYDPSKVAHVSCLLALIEPMQLAVRPELLFMNETFSSNAQVLPHRPLVEGRECLAIDCFVESLPAGGVCQLWVDPLRNYSVMRATFLGPGRFPLAQYDIDYDCEKNGSWLPRMITIVQFNIFGDAYDELQAVRQSYRLDSEEDLNLLAFQPLPGTWVIDQRTQEQYVVGDNGAKHAVSLAEAVKAVNSHSESAQKWYLIDIELSSIQALLVRLSTWPWVLVSLFLVYCVWYQARVKALRLSRDEE